MLFSKVHSGPSGYFYVNLYVIHLVCVLYTIPLSLSLTLLLLQSPGPALEKVQIYTTIPGEESAGPSSPLSGGHLAPPPQHEDLPADGDSTDRGTSPGRGTSVSLHLHRDIQ